MALDFTQKTVREQKKVGYDFRCNNNAAFGTRIQHLQSMCPEDETIVKVILRS
jgi:hypothetical protein